MREESERATRQYEEIRRGERELTKQTPSAVALRLVAAGLAIRHFTFTHPRTDTTQFADLAALARDLVWRRFRVEEFFDAPALQADEMVAMSALVELEYRLARIEMMPINRPACSNRVRRDTRRRARHRHPRRVTACRRPRR